MADRYRAPEGWTVEVVHLTGTPDHHDGEWLRVKQYGIWTADVRTIPELQQWVDLSELEPDWLSLSYGVHLCGVGGVVLGHLWPQI